MSRGSHDNNLQSGTSRELLNVGKRTDNYFLLSLIGQGRGDASGKSSTFKPPRSGVLARVKAFLPEMKAAEDELKGKLARGPAGCVDIENVDEAAEQVIEMNLGLVEDDSILISSDEEEDDSSDSESEAACGGEESVDGASAGARPMPALLGEVTEENIRLSPPTHKNNKPSIEILSSEDEGQS